MSNKYKEALTRALSTAVFTIFIGIIVTITNSETREYWYVGVLVTLFFALTLSAFSFLLSVRKSNKEYKGTLGFVRERNEHARKRNDELSVYDLTALIEIAEILSNGKQALVDEVSLLVNSFEALICKYFRDNEWINLYTLYETRFYTIQNYFFRILTGSWFLLENVPDAHVGYNVVDESFIVTESFITDLNEISKNLNLQINFNELPLNEKNETDLNAVNDFIASKNHTMLTMYDADDSLCLFILPNDTDPERVSRLCDRAGIRF